MLSGKKHTYSEHTPSTAIPAGLARRSRMLLLLANGMTITDIAATVGMSRPHAYKWIRRFMQDGMEGLMDRPQRRGRHRQRRPELADRDDADSIS